MSKTLTHGLVAAGYDVKMSEVHGMAQRGGSVSTQVRYGEKVYSPIIGRGEADVLVAFEKLEAARYSELLKPGGTALINDYEVFPLPVSSGAAEYPTNIYDEMKRCSMCA
ncbi:MAG: 2-oxoacid:acceptor oxidoreductase family protein [Eubacteriales bacterium]